MQRVFRDRWVYLFLALALLTLVFTLSAADASRKVLDMVRVLYDRVHQVERKAESAEEDAAFSVEARKRIDRRLDALERDVRGIRQALERREAGQP